MTASNDFHRSNSIRLLVQWHGDLKSNRSSQFFNSCFWYLSLSKTQRYVPPNPIHPFLPALKEPPYLEGPSCKRARKGKGKKKPKPTEKERTGRSQTELYIQTEMAKTRRLTPYSSLSFSSSSSSSSLTLFAKYGQKSEELRSQRVYEFKTKRTHNSIVMHLFIKCVQANMVPCTRQRDRKKMSMRGAANNK